MSKYSTGFLTGIFFGAAAGTIVGLLYAPDKGENTRDRLSYRLNTYLEELEQLVEKLQSEKEQFKSDAKERGDKVINEAKAQADNLILEAEALISSLKSSSDQSSEADKS